MVLVKSEPEETTINHNGHHGQHSSQPTPTKPEWNDAGLASSGTLPELSPALTGDDSGAAAPAITRQEMIQFLDECAESRASSHLVIGLKNCLSMESDDAITDSLFIAHAKQLRELCTQLPPVHSLACVIHFNHYHTWMISLASELGLRKHEGITHAIIADERAIASRIVEMLSSTFWKGQMLGLRGEQADRVMTLLQQGVDGVGPFVHETDHLDLRRKQFSSFLLKLSIASAMVPTSLFLKKVEADLLQQPFGMGRFSDVLCGTYDNKAVALKRVRLQFDVSELLYQQLCREALPWRQLKHPHILPFLGVEAEAFAPRLCMVSPLMRNGHVLGYLKAHSVNVAGLLRLAAEVADGVAYLHDEGIVHGDLRACNILVDDKDHVQISDFGLASFWDVDLSQISAGMTGNTRWMAPELLNPDNKLPKRTFASDIYSVGGVFLELFTRLPPFSDVVIDAQVVLRVIRGSSPSRPNDEQCHGLHMPDNIWELISRCWEANVEHRPTTGDVKNKTAFALHSLQELLSQPKPTVNRLGNPLDPNSFPMDFTSAVPSLAGLDDFAIFRDSVGGDSTFETEFGQWFNPDDMSQFFV